MYKITAKKIANRVAISRGGSRIRRLPTLQVAGGACIKIAPGRSVVITDEIYENNKSILDGLSSILVVMRLTKPSKDLPDPVEDDTLPPEEVLPEPVLAPVVEEEPVLAPVVEEEPVLAPVVEEEPVLAPVVEEEPVLAPVEVKPKAKRKRRSRAAKKEA